MIYPKDFFDLQEIEYEELFLEDAEVWTALSRLGTYISSFFDGKWPLSEFTGMVEKPLVITDGNLRDDLDVRFVKNEKDVRAFDRDKHIENASIIMPGAFLFDSEVIIGPRTIIEPGALIKGPTVIGADTEVRQGAYLRGNCLIGNHCVVGHATEVKNSIMLDGAAAGHFAYIGDSILGKDVNLGAGTKLANLKMIKGNVTVAADRKIHDTGLRKLGAILGDNTETGCNSVTSPGTLMGPESIVYSGVSVPGGYYGKKSFVMPARGSIDIKNR